MSDPWPLLGETDVLIAPAVHEAFGRTLVEAQLAGVVVIASRDGGHLEIVKHLETGFLATSGDANDFGRWVDYVCSSSGEEQVNSVCSEGFQSARRRYSMNRLVNEIHKIYQEISGKK